MDPETGGALYETGSPRGIPTADDVQPLVDSLDHIVNDSDPKARYAGASPDQLAPSERRRDVAAHAIHAHGANARSWLRSFFPSSQSLDRLFAYEHMGNYVIDRKTGYKNFETMPLYVRVGMHLLFVSGADFVSYGKVERLLIDKSVSQGRVYDQTGPGVLEHIQSFVAAYAIPLDELLEQDLTKYPTFNTFFSRKLRADARPIAGMDDAKIITSPADCRLSVFQSVDDAKVLWIKGKQFTIPTLLYGATKHDGRYDAVATVPAAIAVARLAPQDYHRFHSPVSGRVVSVEDLKGDLYTVNPQAVNEDLNVFTLNKRSVMMIEADLGLAAPVPVAFVAVGAMLVGSIFWSKKPGDSVAKGEELGWFQYGGSTCIVVIPQSAGIRFDDDLLATSSAQMETLVAVGMPIARAGVPPGPGLAKDGAAAAEQNQPAQPGAMSAQGAPPAQGVPPAQAGTLPAQGAPAQGAPLAQGAPPAQGAPLAQAGVPPAQGGAMPPHAGASAAQVGVPSAQAGGPIAPPAQAGAPIAQASAPITQAAPPAQAVPPAQAAAPEAQAGTHTAPSTAPQAGAAAQAGAPAGAPGVPPPQ